jgi:site-specific recombinase XerD
MPCKAERQTAAYRVKERTTIVDGQIKELGHLRAFFTFCLVSKWISKSPAKQLKSPKKPGDEARGDGTL